MAAVDAGGGANELALALAFDAGEPDDLAGMDREIDLIEAVPAQPGDGKQRRPYRVRLGGENLPERPARNQRHDLRRRDRLGGTAVDDLTVAHHRDAVGQFIHLVQPMRDIDDGDTVALELFDQAEQLAHVGLLQRLGRFVEEKHLGPGCERARISTTWRWASESSATRRLIGMRSSSVAIRRQDAVGRLGAARSRQRRRGQLQVFQRGQIRRQRRVLHTPPRRRLAHPPRVRRLDVVAVVIDGAGVGLQHAGSDADQRRLAGAVLADDGVNLAGHDQHVDTLQRLNRAESPCASRRASSAARVP